MPLSKAAPSFSQNGSDVERSELGAVLREAIALSHDSAWLKVMVK